MTTLIAPSGVCPTCSGTDISEHSSDTYITPRSIGVRLLVPLEHTKCKGCYQEWVTATQSRRNDVVVEDTISRYRGK